MNALSKRFGSLLFAALLIASVASAQEANATPYPVSISQGDKIVTEVSDDDHTLCTVGFVDEITRTITMSGHCAKGRAGMRVRTSDGDTIGYVAQNWYDGTNQETDISIISVESGVYLGGNGYSGDHWLKPYEVRKGDLLCSRGASSDSVHCGDVLEVKKNLILTESSAGGIGGDSGGPAWIPGKGFVGVYFGGSSERSVFVHPDPNYETLTEQIVHVVKMKIYKAQEEANNKVAKPFRSVSNATKQAPPHLGTQLDEMLKTVKSRSSSGIPVIASFDF